MTPILFVKRRIILVFHSGRSIVRKQSLASGFQTHHSYRLIHPALIRRGRLK